ncbi:MAG: sigma 54-interacting transcriptional regulator [Vicinamibacterales bacterium]
MRKLEEEMRYASHTNASVMLTGEGGVGKRFAANMMHQLSHNRRAPLVAISAEDAADLARFASASASDPITEGLLQAGENGTLFIQDIEKIPASTQLQLMRFMDWSLTAGRHVRFMTATGTHLFELVKAGQFREDLYYRLNIFYFVIPPLRERPEDIPLMFQHYLSLHTRDEVPQLSNAARQCLVEYSWPGNIRELRTLTRKLSAQRLPDLIEPEHLPRPVGESPVTFS